MAIFDAPPLVAGLLGQDEAERLRKQAIGTGLLSAVIGGLSAAPGYRYTGIAPILGQALQSGMQGVQGTYTSALENFQTQQKIDEMRRQQEQQRLRNEAIANLSPEERNLALIDPNSLGTLLAAKAKPVERKTATVGNKIVDVATGEVIYEGDKARTTKEVDVGNKVLLVDAVTGETIKELPKGVPPKAPSEITYSTEYDKDGNLFYVPSKPGSPILDAQGKPTTKFVPAKAGAEAEAQTVRQQSLATTSKIVIDKVDSALKKVGGFTAGWGGLLANVPGTKARSLQADIDTIKANLGFAELAKMREQSPTGGALGQVAVKELDFLQSTVSNLDQLQDPQSLRKALNEIKASYSRWLNVVKNPQTGQQIPQQPKIVDFGSLK